MTNAESVACSEIYMLNADNELMLAKKGQLVGWVSGAPRHNGSTATAQAA
jgi:hypothetical protein